ncbi:MAG: hypothetical protein M3232_05090 [Thermoproteota archaeon]|nr:hypothetical protein [Thermoproteota archaeon]
MNVCQNRYFIENPKYRMNESVSTSSSSGEDRTGYICEECGERFYSLNEYIAHYKYLHPRSIGTAIT